MSKSNPRQPAASVEAAGRGMAYEMLARAFAYPDVPAFESMTELAALVAAADVDPSIAVVARHALSADRDALEGEHIRLFTLATSRDCPTFESAYVCTDGGQQTSIMADVAAFYRAFGLVLGERSRPDEITVELEFAGFLCRKEAFAIERLGPPRARQARKVQRLFFQDHIGRWAGALGSRVAERGSPGGLYACLGSALAAWVAAERSFLRVADIDVVSAPRMPWPSGRFDPDLGQPNSKFQTAEARQEER